MSVVSSNRMRVTTPELLWHGGGNEHGKPDPVYSVDFHPKEHVMLTTGIDANVPPKGSVRLWKMDFVEEKQEFLIDLSDHQSVVNIARFSPCGRMIASASEKQIVIYTLIAPNKWEDVTEMRQVERLWLRPSLNEVFDLEWSPCGAYVVIGALEGKAEVIRIATRDSLFLPGHTSYVQGVTWDPLNKMIGTESSDRSCRLHMIKYKDSSMVKVAPRGHCVLKMHGGYTSGSGTDATADAATTNAEDDNNAGNLSGGKTQGINMFMDSNVPSFFRRLSFTPDGALLIVPTGIHRNPNSVSTKNKANVNAKSYCTHIFHRDQLLNNTCSMPALSLIGLDDPSVAIRVNPRLFKHVTSANNPDAISLFRGDYRMIFAVITVGSVFIYDTQHPFPLVKFSGLHYAAINDAAWSGDGKFFTFCSSDGYVTIVRMDEGILGEFLEAEKVPETVKASHCCLYDYVPPVVVPAPAEATPAKNGKGSATPKSDSKKSEEKEVEKEDNKEDGKVEVSEPAEEKKSSDADLLSPSKQTKPTEAPTTPMRPVMDANSSDADNSAKKRKRIQPVVIAALGSLSGNTSNICKPSTPAADQSNSSSSASSSSSSSSSAAVTVHHHSNQAAVVSVVEDGKQMSSVTQEIESKQQSEEKKEEGSATKKKRIAPVLLSPTLP